MLANCEVEPNRYFKPTMRVMFLCRPDSFSFDIPYLIVITFQIHFSMFI